MATPLTWIEAPARSPRPNRSLDVIPVHEVSNEHFVGYQFQPDPCGFPKALPQDCYIQYGPTQGTQKGFDDSGNAVVTDVFGVYQGIECFLNGGLGEFRAIAERVLANGEHRVVDARIAGALVGAAFTTPAGATSIETAFAVLEQVLAVEIPGQGYIYLSPETATYAISKNLVYRNIDGTLETYLGTPLIVLTDPSAAATVYASGPINIWRGPVEVVDAPGWKTNMGRALAERLYTMAIECGAWKIGFTAPVSIDPPPPPPDEDPLIMLLGSIPSSPIPDGTDTTITVQTNVAPTDEVYLWYSVNAGPDTLAGEMTQVDPTEYVWNVMGDSTTTGDSVEVWAVSLYDSVPVESNHIVIEVT
jgi:hypothetical protein